MTTLFIFGLTKGRSSKRKKKAQVVKALPIKAVPLRIPYSFQ